jgi:hypothetical protein
MNRRNRPLYEKPNDFWGAAGISFRNAADGEPDESSRSAACWVQICSSPTARLATKFAALEATRSNSFHKTRLDPAATAKIERVRKPRALLALGARRLVAQSDRRFVSRAIRLEPARGRPAAARPIKVVSPEREFSFASPPVQAGFRILAAA